MLHSKTLLVHATSQIYIAHMQYTLLVRATSHYCRTFTSSVLTKVMRTNTVFDKKQKQFFGVHETNQKHYRYRV